MREDAATLISVAPAEREDAVASISATAAEIYIGGAAICVPRRERGCDDVDLHCRCTEREKGRKEAQG